MNEEGNDPRSLRERIGGNAEERLGKALTELLESPLFTGAIGRAFDARGKAAQAQEVALGALNLPSAADVERLTRRLRAVTHRLEGIEEGVERLDTTLSTREIETRLSAIEQQLQRLITRLDETVSASQAPPASASAASALAAKALAAKAASKPGKARAKAKAKAGAPTKA